VELGCGFELQWGLRGSGAGSDGGVEAVEDDVEVAGDFGCKAVYAGDGGEAHEGCDEGIFDHVLPGVFDRESAAKSERGLERPGTGG